jgi:hypothetical protein
MLKTSGGLRRYSTSNPKKPDERLLMTVKPETVDRLLLSKALIAPLRFKPASDRFGVAQHVLAAHDAAELAIAAICSELAVPDISDKNAPVLVEYLRKLKGHSHPGVDVSAHDYVTKLNNVRVSLKHHGITPDPNQWGGVAEKMFGHISTWCHKYLTLNYAELDASDLIRAVSIRELVRLSHSHLRQGQFKECLEILASAIAKSGSELFPRGVHVTVGHADADTALELSGYGVDPARFIVLQRLLPFCTDFPVFKDENKPQWKKTQYGHKANWTKQNAEFAYDETINLLTRLQHANPYPTPYLYEDVFESELVVTRDSPEVTVMSRSLDEWYVREEYGLSFAAGERIRCRARGAASTNITDPAECTEDPENSRFVVAMNPASDKIIATDGVPLTLVFRREDVEIIDVQTLWMTSE